MNHQRGYDRGMTTATNAPPVTIPERISVSATQPDAYQQALTLADAIARSDLERSLVDLIDVRVSQINGCAFCLEMHTSAARRRGASDARLHALNAWDEASVFSARERAALALAEAITLIREGHVPDPIWEAAREQFSEGELSALILNATMMNFWNRLAITSRTTPGKRV